MKDITNVKGQLNVIDRWPLKITKLERGESRAFDRTNGSYYVMLRYADFVSDHLRFEAVAGAFCVNHHFTVRCNSAATAVVIEYPGLHLSESRYYIQDDLGMGNLSYMDGGTNTTAVNPGRLGDPVINYVHFPAGMYQTLHTHPSHRVGMILKGRGQIELDNQQFFEVREGEVFFMNRNVLHNFMCPYDQDVVLFVFAPDSGTGPTDEVNPLKIRTYVGQQRYAK
jgi:quercetin dioxygenase-like cupin family protein